MRHLIEVGVTAGGAEESTIITRGDRETTNGDDLGVVGVGGKVFVLFFCGGQEEEVGGPPVVLLKKLVLSLFHPMTVVVIDDVAPPPSKYAVGSIIEEAPPPHPFLASLRSRSHIILLW